MTREEYAVLKIDLEKMVDRSTVYQVVQALSEICAEKGQHIVENWQDRVTAAPWFRVSNILERTVVASLNMIGI
jgi:hypothetical protein